MKTSTSSWLTLESDRCVKSVELTAHWASRLEYIRIGVKSDDSDISGKCSHAFESSESFDATHMQR